MPDRFSTILVVAAISAVAFSWYITPWDPVETDLPQHTEASTPAASSALELPAPVSSETSEDVDTQATNPRCKHRGSNRS